MPAAATQLRNLIKMMKVRKVSSYEHHLHFKVELLTPETVPACGLTDGGVAIYFQIARAQRCEHADFALVFCVTIRTGGRNCGAQLEN